MGRLFTVAFLLVILAMASGIGAEQIVADGKRLCEAKSQKFKGPCVRESNCASVCETEGFHGGDCRGLRRRCFCTKYC